MTTLTELNDLFVKLAEDLLSSNGQTDPFAENRGVFSSLSQSLNFTVVPRVTVLETALSLMCFEMPEVSRSTIETLVETIVATLSSSISCNASSRIGSWISGDDCAELIEACSHVIPSLQGEFGMALSCKLLRAVLTVAFSVCGNQFPLPTTANEESNMKSRAAVSKLGSLLLENSLPTTITNEAPLRLLLWYLDPLSLRHDISEILREAVARPFLCLKKELHDRGTWRSVIICLITFPVMFIEARALLLNWFLHTGFPPVQELCVELVASVMDALSRPMWWDIPMEVGLKLPFSQAYFPAELHTILMKLAGPVSSKAFLELVHLIFGYPITNHSGLAGFSETVSKASFTSHKVTWGLLMNFPCWFYFATISLFRGGRSQDIFGLKVMAKALETEGEHDLQLKHAAARYLAWILCPTNGKKYDFLVDCLTEVSGSWPPKHKGETHSSQKCTNDWMGRGLKLRRPSYHAKYAKNCQVGQGIGPWIKDFYGIYTKYYQKMVVDNDAAAANLAMVPQNWLFRRIALGVFLGCSGYLDENDCDLLLHFVATGEIEGITKTWSSERAHSKQNFRGQDDSYSSEARDEIKSVVSGASLVFNIFDVIEDMSTSICYCTESENDFVCLLKGQASKYLVRCVTTLLELDFYAYEGRVQMLMDLNTRLERWRLQGKEIFKGYEVVIEVVKSLRFRISSINGLL
ncbi:uncharacterized protein [Aristolochia californica]|uniref:uncharacterized protein n=1 Tax=Aristolochia californica TaxID=171875 RepID=UPI0035DEB488